jgi:methylated-DNA-[protein]-cysteine S-methyltransferase
MNRRLGEAPPVWHDPTMNPNVKHETVRLPIPTPDGEFIASYSAKGLARLSFPSRRHAAAASAIGVPRRLRHWHRLATAALRRALAGRAPQALPPLDVSGGTPFQKQVWRELRKIACGRTRSYADLARAIGKPKAARAVGGACGANPVPVLVPCHRVLAANRRIGGFSGGLGWKKTLLAREGAVVG